MSMSAKKMVAERLLNNASILAAPKMTNAHSRLIPKGELERRSSETQQQRNPTLSKVTKNNYYFTFC